MKSVTEKFSWTFHATFSNTRSQKNEYTNTKSIFDQNEYDIQILR